MLLPFEAKSKYSTTAYAELDGAGPSPVDEEHRRLIKEEGRKANEEMERQKQLVIIHGEKAVLRAQEARAAFEVCRGNKDSCGK
jgi:hypothetical protein